MTLAKDRSAEAAWASLAGFVAHPRHEFWVESFGYTELKPNHITGAKQVTDAWLVELARRKGGRLVTFDGALARWQPKVADSRSSAVNLREAIRGAVANFKKSGGQIPLASPATGDSGTDDLFELIATMARVVHSFAAQSFVLTRRLPLARRSLHRSRDI